MPDVGWGSWAGAAMADAAAVAGSEAAAIDPQLGDLGRHPMHFQMLQVVGVPYHVLGASWEAHVVAACLGERFALWGVRHGA